MNIQDKNFSGIMVFVKFKHFNFLGYFEELNTTRFNQTKQEFKEILSCFFQTYKTISTFVVKYKNLF